MLTFFMFLLVVSRIYDPMQVSLQNLAAIIASDVQSSRLDEILSHEVQEGSTQMNHQGYDITFSHVGFSYDTGDVVLKDVSFTAKQGQVTALVGPSGGGKIHGSPGWRPGSGIRTEGTDDGWAAWTCPRWIGEALLNHCTPSYSRMWRCLPTP